MPLVHGELVQLVGQRSREFRNRIGHSMSDRKHKIANLAVGKDICQALLEVDHEAEWIAQEVYRAQNSNGVRAQLLCVMVLDQIQNANGRVMLVHEYERLQLDLGVLELNEWYAKARLDAEQVRAQLGGLVDAQGHAEAVDAQFIEAVFNRLRVGNYLRNLSFVVAVGH